MKQFNLRAALFLSAIIPAAALAQTNLVIVSGLGGDPKYTQSFSEQSAALAQAASAKAGLADSQIVWFAATPNPTSRWYRGPSSRENIEKMLVSLSAGGPNEQLILVLIGHGAGEGMETRISLPGPDLTAADFARLLARFGEKRVAFVNLTSASGDMVPLISAPTRVVLTATKSAFERNESQFARFFIDAFAKDGADTDKDNRISLFEAFTYAQAETKRFYENDSRLATEHALLSDESQLSRRFFLSGSGIAVPAGANSRLAALYNERNSLDEQIQRLRRRKDSMAADAYDRELERLLVSLAEKTRQIKELEPKS